MPIFEYQCPACGNRFEQLVRASTVLRCPNCQGENLDKQLSVFSANVAAVGASPLAAGACGSCGHPDGPVGCAFH